jgi:hypothetical protein
MIRAAVLGLILLLLLCPSACTAQQEAAATTDATQSDLPNFGARTVPGEAIVDLADFVDGNLAATGSVPDLAQVRTADGELRTMTAAEVFVLLARTAYLWRTTGAMPETVPITPDEVTAPVLDVEDAVLPPEDLEVGREVATEQFLAQCPAVVRWADRLQVIPTAVWVDGKRLSAAEYLAGLAVCVSYAYWDGQLSETIFLPIYAPPKSWGPEVEPAYANAEYAQAEEAGGEQPLAEGAEASQYAEGEEAQYADESESGGSPGEQSPEGYEEEGGLAQEEYLGGYEEAAPQEGVEEEYAPEPEAHEETGEPAAEVAPKLAVIPEPGDTVSGIVDMVASYSGPPARFVIFTVDAKADIIMNSPPYSYRWDTSALKPGTHQVRIQVLGEDDRVLIDQTSAYTVVAPTPRKSPGSVGS